MAKKKKRPTVLKVFDFIVAFKKENDGIAPSHREIMEGVQELNTISVVNFHLDRLAQLGRIMRKPGQSRYIKVKGGKWTHEEETAV